MIRNFRIFFFAALLAVVSVSCADPRKVSVSQPVTLTMETAAKWTVTCRVTNCAAHRVTIGEARLTVHYRDANLGTMMLGAPVTVPRCSVSDLEIPVRVRLTNDPLTLLSVGSLRNLSPDDLFVTGEAVLKSGIGRKKIRFDRYPLSELLTNFAPTGFKVSF